jgi:flavin-dependent dehydrogenase
MLELDIIIVGAGISGLASAIVLSRSGHNVQVSTVGSQIMRNNYKVINKVSLRF